MRPQMKEDQLTQQELIAYLEEAALRPETNFLPCPIIRRYLLNRKL